MELAGVDEELIIVPLADGVTNGELAHLPAVTIGEFTPYRAAAKCGIVGIVYARAGAFTDIPICESCEIGAVQTHIQGIEPEGPHECPRCGGPKSRKNKQCAACHEETRPKAQHGTLSFYNRGCRCDQCSEARRDYHQKRRARLIAELKIRPGMPGRRRQYFEHGSNAMYQRGCRCDSCRAGHTQAMRDWKARRAA